MSFKRLFIYLVIISLTILVKCQEDIPEKIMKTMREKLSTKELFKVYGLLYNKSYNYESEETIKRYKAFKQNLKRMDSEIEYSFGFTDHFDITEEEFKSIAEKSFLKEPKETPKELYSSNSLSAPFPAPIDHRSSGCLNEVTIHKDISFGSHLALVASTEFITCKRSGAKVTLSSQQLLDCESSSGTMITDNHKYYLYKTGLYNIIDYPNTGPRSACKVFTGKSLVRVNSYVHNTYFWSGMQFDIISIYNALKEGPIIVSINFYDVLYNYKGGIVSPLKSTNVCSFYTTVLVVGYGIENNVEFWVIRGMFGPTWGEQGYLRLKRDDSKLNWGINCGYIRVN